MRPAEQCLGPEAPDAAVEWALDQPFDLILNAAVRAMGLRTGAF